LNARITAKSDIEAQQAADVVYQILKSPGVLRSRGAKALLDVVPNLSHFGYVVLEEFTKTLPGSIVSRRIV
jgi:hypothetical protein